MKNANRVLSHMHTQPALDQQTPTHIQIRAHVHWPCWIGDAWQVWLRPYQPATLLQLYHVCSISVERMHKYSYHCAKNHFLKWLKITRGKSSSLEDLLCCSGSFFSCPVDCEAPYSETVVAFTQISHIKTTCLSPSCHSSGLVRTFWVGLWCVVILRIRIWWVWMPHQCSVDSCSPGHLWVVLAI